MNNPTANKQKRMKQCSCSTNTILLMTTKEGKKMICLKCKTPYVVKESDTVSISMPIQHLEDGNQIAEIVWNTYV